MGRLRCVSRQLGHMLVFVFVYHHYIHVCMFWQRDDIDHTYQTERSAASSCPAGHMGSGLCLRISAFILDATTQRRRWSLSRGRFLIQPVRAREATRPFTGVPGLAGPSLPGEWAFRSRSGKPQAYQDSNNRDMLKPLCSSSNEP